MIAHSVDMFRNYSVVHDLSTSKDYSTILYKFISIWDAEKNKRVWKKQILELKQQRLSVAKISKVVRRSRRVIHN